MRSILTETGHREAASRWTTKASTTLYREPGEQRHTDGAGECKKVMMDYLTCMKKVRGVNEDECRGIAKSYLACRMER